MGVKDIWAKGALAEELDAGINDIQMNVAELKTTVGKTDDSLFEAGESEGTVMGKLNRIMRSASIVANEEAHVYQHILSHSYPGFAFTTSYKEVLNLKGYGWAQFKTASNTNTSYSITIDGVPNSISGLALGQYAVINIRFKTSIVIQAKGSSSFTSDGMAYCVQYRNV